MNPAILSKSQIPQLRKKLWKWKDEQPELLSQNDCEGWLQLAAIESLCFGEGFEGATEETALRNAESVLVTALSLGSPIEEEKLDEYGIDFLPLPGVVEALAGYQIRLKPKDPKPFRTLYDSAIDIWERACDGGCDMNMCIQSLADLWIGRAQYEISLRQFKQASEVLKKAISNDLVQHCPEVWMTYIDMSVSRGKLNNARVLYRQALQEIPAEYADDLYESYLRFEIDKMGHSGLDMETLKECLRNDKPFPSSHHADAAKADVAQADAAKADAAKADAAKADVAQAQAGVTTLPVSSETPRDEPIVEIKQEPAEASVEMEEEVTTATAETSVKKGEEVTADTAEKSVEMGEEVTTATDEASVKKGEEFEMAEASVEMGEELTTETAEASVEMGEEVMTDAAEATVEKEVTTETAEATVEKGDEVTTETAEASVEMGEEVTTETAETTVEKGEEVTTETAEATVEKGDEVTTETTEASVEMGEEATTETAETTVEKGEEVTTETAETTVEKGEVTTEAAEASVEKGEVTTETAEASVEIGEEVTTETAKTTVEKGEVTTEAAEATVEMGEEVTTETAEASVEMGEEVTTETAKTTVEKGEEVTTEAAEATVEKGDEVTTETAEASVEMGEEVTTETAETTVEKGEEVKTETAEATVDKGVTTVTTVEKGEEFTKATESSQPKSSANTKPAKSKGEEPVKETSEDSPPEPAAKPEPDELTTPADSASCKEETSHTASGDSPLPTNLESPRKNPERLPALLSTSRCGSTLGGNRQPLDPRRRAVDTRVMDPRRSGAPICPAPSTHPLPLVKPLPAPQPLLRATDPPLGEHLSRPQPPPQPLVAGAEGKRSAEVLAGGVDDVIAKRYRPDPQSLTQVPHKPLPEVGVGGLSPAHAPPGCLPAHPMVPVQAPPVVAPTPSPIPSPSYQHTPSPEHTHASNLAREEEVLRLARAKRAGHAVSLSAVQWKAGIRRIARNLREMQTLKERSIRASREDMRWRQEDELRQWEASGRDTRPLLRQHESDRLRFDDEMMQVVQSMTVLQQQLLQRVGVPDMYVTDEPDAQARQGRILARILGDG